MWQDVEVSCLFDPINEYSQYVYLLSIIYLNFSVQFTMDGLRLRMENLFEGVKVLGN